MNDPIESLLAEVEARANSAHDLVLSKLVEQLGSSKPVDLIPELSNHNEAVVRFIPCRKPVDLIPELSNCNEAVIKFIPCRKHTVLLDAYTYWSIKFSKAKSRGSSNEIIFTGSQYGRVKRAYKQEECKCADNLPIGELHYTSLCSKCGEAFNVKNECRHPIHLAYKRGRNPLQERLMRDERERRNGITSDRIGWGDFKPNGYVPGYTSTDWCRQ